mmetsp:Transcript_10584/g.35076  ORF Transcript_10584/g.35076 Transcript_10584/m.35076 type:complete len:235 (+) Transcript_10584:1147-1851(+)
MRFWPLARRQADARRRRGLCQRQHAHGVPARRRPHAAPVRAFSPGHHVLPRRAVQQGLPLPRQHVHVALHHRPGLCCAAGRGRLRRRRRPPRRGRRRRRRHGHAPILWKRRRRHARDLRRHAPDHLPPHLDCRRPHGAAHAHHGQNLDGPRPRAPRPPGRDRVRRQHGALIFDAPRAPDAPAAAYAHPARAPRRAGDGRPRPAILNRAKLEGPLFYDEHGEQWHQGRLGRGARS